MSIQLRPVTAEDVPECGRICFDAFAAIADEHRFPRDFPSVEVSTGMLDSMVAHPGFYGVLAEDDGRIAGSNFMDERGNVFGLGPITVDPDIQNGTIGRTLMQHMIDRTAERGARGVRLVQAAYHNRSLCLYQKLGFDTCEPLSNLCGEPPRVTIPGHQVRPAVASDVADCNAICSDVLGFDRAGQLQDAIDRGAASVVEHDDQIVGYTTGVNFSEHSVARTDDALKALIAAAPEIPAPGFLLPARNAELFRWCLLNGLRQTQLLTLMAMGEYRQPTGAYLCSILY
jgi:predicted N-acetyltransferase YhbS